MSGDFTYFFGATRWLSLGPGVCHPSTSSEVNAHHSPTTLSAPSFMICSWTNKKLMVPSVGSPLRWSQNTVVASYGSGSPLPFEKILMADREAFFEERVAAKRRIVLDGVSVDVVTARAPEAKSGARILPRL